MKALRRTYKVYPLYIGCVGLIIILLVSISLPCICSSAKNDKLPGKLSLYCSSGAGAWGINLTIKKNGRFKGEHHDTDMDSGPGYDATIYYSNFKGKFANIKKKGKYTYAMKVKTVTLKDTPGIQYKSKRTLFKACDTKLKKGKYTLFCPGLPTNQLPAEAREWLILSCFIDESMPTLDGYVLYCKGDNPYFGR